MGRPLRATVHHSDGDVSRIWVDPPDRKRIESTTGQPAYIENAEAEYRWHDGDGIMIRDMKSPHRLVSTIRVGPEHLVAAYRFWPRPESQTDLGTPAQPRSTQIRGRQGWQVDFTPTGSPRKRMLAPVTYVIDAELGVALAWRQGEKWIELSDPVLDEDFDDALFVWDGAIREREDQTSIQQREHEEHQRQLAQMPRSVPTWLPSTVTSNVIEGDPKTGAMDLAAHLQHAQVAVRRWLTDLDEPPETFHMQMYPHAQRQQQGPWTLEIRTQQEIPASDGRRILDSITPVPPPSQTPAVIRAELERQRLAKKEAEETAALGTGRQLRDYLGPNQNVSLLIRTDFTDDALWRETAVAAGAPVPTDYDIDFQAAITCIDHPDNDGLTVHKLLELIGSDPPYYVFLADHETIVNPEHPIVAVDTSPEATGHRRGQTIRVIPEQMWSIENNLSLANMSFGDFVRTTDPDGVYRGIPKVEPAGQVTTAELLDAIAQHTSTETLARLHQTLQELEHSRIWQLSRADFAQNHKHVSETDYSEATTLGREDYLAATAAEGSALRVVITLPGGDFWDVLLEDNTLRPIAAMLVQLPPPPARQ
jgi:hypothetical protein